LQRGKRPELMASGTDVRAVTGLGQDAYNGRLMGYNVQKGNRWVQVFGALSNENAAANDKSDAIPGGEGCFAALGSAVVGCRSGTELYSRFGSETAPRKKLNSWDRKSGT
jgi:hypothetical protein